MWLLCEDGKREGAYAVKDINNDKVLFLFEQEDDAERYRMQLESEEDAIMEVVEVDEDVAIKACEMYNYKYTIVTPNDFVILRYGLLNNTKHKASNMVDLPAPFVPTTIVVPSEFKSISVHLSPVDRKFLNFTFLNRIIL